MKRALALAAATLTLALVVAGCGPRTERGERVSTDGTSTSQGDAVPPAAADAGGSGVGSGVGSGGGSGGGDAAAVDAELAGVDGLLAEIEAEFAQTDRAPEDAD
jgi:hypothetical protein